MMSRQEGTEMKEAGRERAGRILQNIRIIHSNLLASVGLGQLVFLIGIDKTESKVICSLISVVIFYFLSCAFCWMLVEAIHLYVNIVQVFSSEFKAKKYMALGWGVTVATSSQQLTSERYCWLPVDGNKILAFIIPTGIIIGVNLVLLLAVLYEINKLIDRNITDVKISRSRTTAKTLLLMLPLIGLPWLLAFFALNSSLVVFDYLFNIFNGFQGLWIFLIHIVGNQEVRHRLRAKVRPQSVKSDWTVRSTTTTTRTSRTIPMSNMENNKE
ncbi:putative G-protein coupled receptor [Apostichopus japonicus]|uniref:Putative G-protein coupled receptor n=1 Tax=Stichopus japonicus TaxID=307972 RepID=A0A2G8KHT1_STIJA|nr:putative G-protein coupled receptor [Apostichopus japonicus]